HYFGTTLVAPALLAACAVTALLPPRGWRRRPAGEAAPSGARSEPAWWSSGGISLPSVAAPLLVVPAALLLLESAVGSHLYVDRYVLYGEAGAALLAGGGVYRLGAGAGRPGRPRGARRGAGGGGVRWRAAAAAHAPAAGPRPGQPPVQLRRPRVLHRGALPPGRRGDVLQLVLPQGQARLPEPVPEDHRFRDGGLASGREPVP